ncbi:MAG: polysaccharide biosynthesis protein [Clostridia bacterium]|nr:polysaccharide biosynthesis protein [Clostridia bacterium]
MSENNGVDKAIKSSTRLFISGTVVLTVFNIINKLLGLVFKIEILNIIGEEGNGYFNQAHNVYTTLYMLSTAGLPTAVAMMISEARAKGSFSDMKRIYRVALLIFSVVGVVGTAVMIIFSGELAGTKSASYAIEFIAPTLFFMCIVSILRGYFQGFQVMTPTAVSEFIESLSKLVIGIFCAAWAIANGEPVYMAAAYAILGITVGAGLEMIFLFICKLFFREKKYCGEYMELPGAQNPTPAGTLAKRLIMLAIPITLAASLMPLSELLNMKILSARLTEMYASSYSDASELESVVNTIYGNWSMCVTFFDLPPVLIYPIAHSLVPMIKSTLTRGDRERADTFMNISIRVAAILAIPCAFGMAAMAKPILRTIYSESTAESGAPLLAIISPAIFFVCMLSVSNALLQAGGHERLPMVSIAVGVVIKLLVINFLTPVIGIYAAAVSTLVCYFVVSALNTFFMIKYVGVKLSFTKMFLRPIIAGAVCAAAAYGSYSLFDMFLSNAVSTFLGIGVAVIVYAIAIFLIRAVSEEELLMIPKYGVTAVKILKRLRLLPRSAETKGRED